MSATTCPAYWVSEADGWCPENVTPDGKHHCGLDGLDDEHTMCRCACGSTHKRPVDHAARFDARRQVSVTVDERGIGRVVLGGVNDISDHVSGGTLKFEAGHPTVVEVELVLASAFARGEIELDEETAKALEALGWSGPDTELLRRRDLQEALGGLGSVLREWDDLLGVVRRMREALLDSGWGGFDE